MKITILGAGLVGRAIIRDMASNHDLDVQAVDLSSRNLENISADNKVETVEADLSDASVIPPIISDSDLVVCAVPGFMGFQTMEAIIKAGKNVVDIAFYKEDPFELDELAQNNGVTAVVDCGVAPGLSNIQAGYAETQFDKLDSYTCYVGGLPKLREWPYEYKAVFSPRDVLEEYIRPARYIENSKEIVKPALTDVESIDFKGIGTLEAFNTDGLRSLVKTMKIQNMKEKTLRYPGHANLMRVYRDSGFFNEIPLPVGGYEVAPLDLTSRLLFDQWKLKEGEEDFTVMRVTLEGTRAGKHLRVDFELYDEYDPVKGIHSMARTTGYTCAIVSRLVLDGTYKTPGISPPEFLGRQAGLYKIMLKEYKRRGIEISETYS